MDLLMACPHSSSRAGASVRYLTLVLCGSLGAPPSHVLQSGQPPSVVFFTGVTSYIHDCQAQLQLS